MFDTGDEERDAINIKITKYFEIILIVLGIMGVLVFAIMFMQEIIARPTKSVLMGREIENKYRPRFEKGNAIFDFNEETETFTLEMKDFTPGEAPIYMMEFSEFVKPGNGWNVIVEKLPELSLIIKEESGFLYEFKVIDPENESDFILSVEDGEVLYNKFPQ